MAATLRLGTEAALSHESAAALWGIRDAERSVIEVSVPYRVTRHAPGIRVHRRRALADADLVRRDVIPTTSVCRTIVDLGCRLEPAELAEMINAADKRDLTSPVVLRATLDRMAGQPGVASVRALLDRQTFRLTDSELERRFLRLVERAGLPRPLTQQRVNGFRVDFYWPELGLVVETDGLRYHRTPAQQAKDKVRDHAHSAAGTTSVRFTHAQIHYEPAYVRRVLNAVIARLGAGG